MLILIAMLVSSADRHRRRLCPAPAGASRLDPVEALRYE